MNYSKYISLVFILLLFGCTHQSESEQILRGSFGKVNQELSLIKELEIERITKASDANSKAFEGVGITATWNYKNRQETVMMIFEADGINWSVKGIGFENYEQIPQADREELVNEISKALAVANHTLDLAE